MMKKLSLSSFLCIASFSPADQISDAIRKSDMHKVRMLLAESRPTDKQLIKYLDIAEQIIRTRRDQLNSKPGETPSVSLKAMDYWALTTLACSTGAASFAVLEEYYYMHLSFVGLIISTIGLIACDTINRSRSHENAIMIKELLYDYADLSN